MDFGDLIFFVIFVGIIIANIVKQVKKAEKMSSAENAAEETPGKETKKSPEKPSPKPSPGWKKVLEQMLEEASKQLEEKTAPAPADAPAGRSSGWDDIILEKTPPSREPDKRPRTRPETKQEKRSEIRQSKRPRQASVMRKDAVLQKKPVFRPECMRCNAAMKEITDLGIPDQRGLVYCDNCGEQHQYRIVDGHLKLKSAQMKRQPLASREKAYEAAPPASPPVPGAGYAPARPKLTGDVSASGIYRRLSRNGLQNAVVWSEILGKPLGLRDM